MLTAAHCICEFYDEDDPTDPKYDPVNKYCDLNPTAAPLTQIPINQQTEKTVASPNYLTIMVGDKNYEDATTINVQAAYVMQTKLDSRDKVVLKELFDIGIIDPDSECDIVRLSNNQHLTLPEM